MVTGVFSIPLATDVRTLPTAGAASSAALREFIGDERNAMLDIAVRDFLSPRCRFNPLILIGPGGCGKSTLALGLAQRWQQAGKAKRTALVTTGTDYARAFAHAIDTDDIATFRQRTRRCRLLVIDDLHQLASKSAAQGELVQTFDQLLQRRTQLLFTLPADPRSIENFSPNLISRLSGGLVIEIAQPGPDAQDHILRRLAESMALQLEPDARSALIQSAQRFQGAVSPVAHFRRMLIQLHQSLDQGVQRVEACLVQELFGASGERELSAPAIASQVARRFQLRLKDLKGPGRQRHVITARGIAMLLTRRHTNQTLQQIGAYYGKRDHTTVLHACRRTQQQLEQDPALEQTFVELRNSLLKENYVENLSIDCR